MSEHDSVLFNVDINNYNGPLDVLLDLAKAQKVDLEELSITKLADQFHNYITKEKNLNLEIASEYLLMATWLAYLKSKLLLPGTPEEEFKVQEVADRLKLQLKKLELIRLLSEQMLKRKRLGREIRARGIKGNIRSIYSSEYNLSLFELFTNISAIFSPPPRENSLGDGRNDAFFSNSLAILTTISNGIDFKLPSSRITLFFASGDNWFKNAFLVEPET